MAEAMWEMKLSYSAIESIDRESKAEQQQKKIQTLPRALSGQRLTGQVKEEQQEISTRSRRFFPSKFLSHMTMI